MSEATLFASNQKLKMMRILMITLLLFVCARSVAQTTLITNGPIRMGIKVYDYKNDQHLDISKLCQGFDADGVPEDLVLPLSSSITIFFPDITEANASDYVVYEDGQRKQSLDNYNLQFEYEGKRVSNPINRSSSAGADHTFGIVYSPNEVSPANMLKNVGLHWRIDYGPIELMAFIQNDEIDERQLYRESIMGNLFSSDEIVKGYDYWLEKGYAQRLDEKGLPENPIIPIDAGIISFVTNAPDIELTKDGQKVDFSRFEDRSFSEGAVYYFKPDESGSYLLRLTDIRKVYGQVTRTYAFSVPFNFWKEGGYWVIAPLMVALSLFLWFRSVAKKKLAQSNLLKQLSDAELKAIRSQLNPHFLFNALSAIQNLVNQSKNDLANDYIVKLSKLLRRVLVQSDESLHSLQEELELAELYLELENLRMPFEYHIIVDEGLDKNMLIPSMILQPYLENAVFHGVSKFKADKITLEVQQKGAQLECVVSDNATHEGNFFTEGKGMSMGRDRIEILKKQLGEEIKADIQTKKGSAGFEVSINLPMNL